MNNLLVKFKDDWADEMDLEGFFITTKEDWENRVTLLKDNFPYGLTYSVGTNEEIEYSRPDEILKKYKVQDLSDHDASLLENLFDTGKFGFAGPLVHIDYYMDNLDLEDDE